MGVPKETVYEDYLRSNDYILPAYQGAIDADQQQALRAMYLN
jgi:protein tyrosine/serine phosphatase